MQKKVPKAKISRPARLSVGRSLDIPGDEEQEDNSMDEISFTTRNTTGNRNQTVPPTYTEEEMRFARTASNLIDADADDNFYSPAAGGTPRITRNFFN